MDNCEGNLSRKIKDWIHLENDPSTCVITVVFVLQLYLGAPTKIRALFLRQFPTPKSLHSKETTETKDKRKEVEVVFLVQVEADLQGIGEVCMPAAVTVQLQLGYLDNYVVHLYC